MENILGVFLFIMLYFDYICNDIAGGRITFPCFLRVFVVAKAKRQTCIALSRYGKVGYC